MIEFGGLFTNSEEKVCIYCRKEACLEESPSGCPCEESQAGEEQEGERIT
jgi:hypothetical protein